MASSDDKKKARTIQRANPHVKYTEALRAVQDRSGDAPQVTGGESWAMVWDPHFDLATPKDLLARYPDLNERTCLVMRAGRDT